MKVIGLEMKSGNSPTIYTDQAFIFLPADGNIPSFGQQFDLVAIPFIEKVPA